MDHDPRCTRTDATHCDTTRRDTTRRDTTRRDTTRREPAHRDPARLDAARLDADPAAAAPVHDPPPGVDWLTAQIEVDECDGYVVLAVDPQTGEVDAHGPFAGFEALEAAQSLRETLDREELADVVVRVVRWHQNRPGQAA
ncbi:hypothetical protein [Actinomycetospora sp. NBRC 106375]|uniref:hypothetical protein n=1 Tax=Actinomycetospora sp. NBRC 106375 TaxID=3032207 RepID=UPI0025539DAD|nr:hypothetical protein [Actinomycetospora sp. NBRC 106375]